MTEYLWFLDTLVTPHVAHDLGADGLSVLESRAPKGDSPPWKNPPGGTRLDTGDPGSGRADEGCAPRILCGDTHLFLDL